jgi:hypothetical protein
VFEREGERERGRRERESESLNEFKEILYWITTVLFLPIGIVIKSKQADGQFTGMSARVAERIRSQTLRPIEDMF